MGKGSRPAHRGVVERVPPGPRGRVCRRDLKGPALPTTAESGPEITPRPWLVAYSVGVADAGVWTSNTPRPWLMAGPRNYHDSGLTK